MSAHPYIGAGRGGAAPLPNPETHNPDFGLTLTTAGGVTTCNATVIVRNNGDVTTKKNIAMNWCPNTTGDVLYACYTSDGTTVKIANLDLPIGATGPHGFAAFPLPSGAQKLVIVAQPAPGCPRDNDPGCGVQNL